MKLPQSLQQLAIERIVHDLSSFNGLTPTALAMVHNYIRTLKIHELTEIIVDTGNWEILEVEGAEKLSKTHMLEIAGRRGNIDMINELAVDIDYINMAMIYAATGGHMDIVMLMLERGAEDYHGAMAGAYRGGHIDIIRLMLDRGTDDYDRTIDGDDRRYYIDIVRLIKNSR